MPQQVKKSLVLSIYFALAVSALLVFWQVRNFDFVNYDDELYVYENQHVVSGLTFDNIVWAFTTIHTGYWHALTWLSLMLDCQLFGSNPAGFHLTNLFFHIANALLLFLVLKQMTKAIWQSAFTAALFALHPLHVESVAWIAERKDVLSTFFWMLTLLAYFIYVSRPSVFRYIATLAAFALGLMAKPMLVTLPFVLLLLDYWPLYRIKHFDRQVVYRLVLEKIPFIVLSIVSSVIVFLAQQSSRAVMSFAKFPLKFRIGSALISYARYIEKMFCPTGLAPFYPHPYGSVSVLYAIISAILLLAVTILVIRFAKNHRYLVTGWFWYLGTLIPVIGIIQVGLQAYADRYTYTPYIGLFIMLAWGLPQLLSGWPQRKIALGISMVIVLTASGICAYRQTSFWNNSLTLFSHTIEVTQNNYIAYNNLGSVYNGLGRYDEAIEFYKQAIKTEPGYAAAYNNLGVAYSSIGRYKDAIDAFKQAIEIRTDYAEAYYNLGFAYDKFGRAADAIDTYKQTVKIKPDYAQAYNNLGVAYAKLGRFTEAIDAFKQTINIKPDLAEAHKNLGLACLAIGDKSSAMAEYNILESLDPQLANRLLNQINQ
jgi:Flp pilus assembly protein TadD